MKSKEKVLFVCVHNSARSQMGEAFLKKIAGDRFEVESAGLEPGTLNPVVVEAMKELGIDISRNRTKSVYDLFKEGRKFDHVITVCDESRAGSCPVFPASGERVHWGFEDPSAFRGTHEQKLAATRQVRDRIRETIEEWIKKPGRPRRSG